MATNSNFYQKNILKWRIDPNSNFGKNEVLTAIKQFADESAANFNVTPLKSSIENSFQIEIDGSSTQELSQELSNLERFLQKNFKFQHFKILPEPEIEVFLPLDSQQVQNLTIRDNSLSKKVKNGKLQLSGLFHDVISSLHELEDKIFEMEFTAQEQATNLDDHTPGRSRNSSEVDNKNDEVLVGCLTLKNKNIQVRFVIGDIIQQQTDAIVNSSNFKLKFTGQVSQAIRLVAGPGVVKQCQDYIGQNQSLDVSDVFVTDGGHLQCKHIMHTSTPAYKNDGLDNYQKPLADTYLNCLNKALKKDIQSISFPILGSGNANLSDDLTALSFISALSLFDRSEPVGKKPHSLRSIYMVNLSYGKLSGFFKKCAHVLKRYTVDSIEIRSDDLIINDTADDTNLNSPANTATNFHQPVILKSSQSSSSSSTSRLMTSPRSCCSSCGAKKSKESLACGHSVCGSCLKNNSACKICPPRNNFKSFSTAAEKISQIAPVHAPKDRVSHKVAKVVTLGDRRRSGSVDTRPKSRTKTIDSSQSKDDLTSASDCPICLSQITSRPKILSCGHCFCVQCINQWLVAHNKCPVCNRCFGVQRGNQPDGRMDVSNEPYSLPGYEGYTSIKIQYSFPDGIQQKDQPNPGKPYTGTRRIAYLPDNQDGREVLHLLKIAFDNRLIFTIGRSNTTGRDNVIVWNDVHHKTSTSGTHGYPDSGYLNRVKDELQAKGITTELLSVKK